MTTQIVTVAELAQFSIPAHSAHGMTEVHDAIQADWGFELESLEMDYHEDSVVAKFKDDSLLVWKHGDITKCGATH